MSARPGPFDLAQSMNEAMSLQRAGRLREAEKIYARVLKAAPDHFGALSLLGAVKARLGHFGEAQRLFSAATKVNPQAPEAWSNLGQALHALKRAPEALQCLDKARALAPDDIEVINQRANVLLTLDRPREAFTEFALVLARAPTYVEARINSGLAQATLGFPELALAEFDRALALVPNHPMAQFNRGVALMKLGRYAEALTANERALAGAPDHIGAWLNRGRALAQLNRNPEAIVSYGKVTAIRKDHADALFNEAIALLTLGQYRPGFEKYEWRWRRSSMPAQPSRGRPLWRGEYPLARKTVLVHAEQGLGDTIQFARYVPMLAAGGAKIVLEVQAELRRLMVRISGADAVVARGETPPPFDVHCPLGSLPLAFKTESDTVPAPMPYLSADPAQVAKWSPRIEQLARPRVAITWAGNPNHDNDRNRSMAFATLARLFRSTDVAQAIAPASFVSIQRDLRVDDQAPLATASVTHVGGELDDFSDTAAVLALCDLVIAVDTAVAHLAGAMGRPLWVLLPFAPDWRWTLDGQNSPWYPAARLFRQRSEGDWDGVIERVGTALADFTRRAA